MNSKPNKLLKVVFIVIIALLILCIAGVFVLSALFSSSNSAPSIFGQTVFIMESGEMSPAIPKGAAVFAETGVLPQVKEVALCKTVDGEITTALRVVDIITEEDGSVVYVVRYDNSEENTAQYISADNVIGKAVTYSIALGAVIRFATSPLGILCIVIIPCAIIVIYQVVMLILSRTKAKKLRAVPFADYPMPQEFQDEKPDENEDMTRVFAKQPVAAVKQQKESGQANREIAQQMHLNAAKPAAEYPHREETDLERMVREKRRADTNYINFITATKDDEPKQKEEDSATAQRVSDEAQPEKEIRPSRPITPATAKQSEIPEDDSFKNLMFKEPNEPNVKSSNKATLEELMRLLDEENKRLGGK